MTHIPKLIKAILEIFLALEHISKTQTMQSLENHLHKLYKSGQNKFLSNSLTPKLIRKVVNCTKGLYVGTLRMNRSVGGSFHGAC